MALIYIKKKANKKEGLFTRILKRKKEKKKERKVVYRILKKNSRKQTS